MTVFYLSSAQIIAVARPGKEIIDTTKIEKWLATSKSEYMAQYHFGFSDDESTFNVIAAGDSCYAQLEYGEFISSTEYAWYYFPFKKVRIEGNKFFSDETNGEFVIYDWDNNKIKGLIIHKPWRRFGERGFREFGTYSSVIDSMFFSGKYPFTSYEFLSEEKLQNMAKQDLKIMRNEIYARYNYIFTPGGEMDKYFRTLNWYSAINKSVDSFMTDIEKQNIELIKKAEKKLNGL